MKQAAHAIFVACVLAAALAVAMTAAAEVRDMGGMVELTGDGPWQRFIVKYRADSGPGRDPGAVQARLERALSDTGIAAPADDGSGLQLEWKRRLGVGADLFQADRPLDRDRARRLLETLAADPDVEYVEAEVMMQAGPPAIRHR